MFTAFPGFLIFFENHQPIFIGYGIDLFFIIFWNFRLINIYRIIFYGVGYIIAITKIVQYFLNGFILKIGIENLIR